MKANLDQVKQKYSAAWSVTCVKHAVYTKDQKVAAYSIESVGQITDVMVSTLVALDISKKMAEALVVPKVCCLLEDLGGKELQAGDFVTKIEQSEFAFVFTKLDFSTSSFSVRPFHFKYSSLEQGTKGSILSDYAELTMSIKMETCTFLATEAVDIMVSPFKK